MVSVVDSCGVRILVSVSVARYSADVTTATFIWNAKLFWVDCFKLR